MNKKITIEIDDKMLDFILHAILNKREMEYKKIESVQEKENEFYRKRFIACSYTFMEMLIEKFEEPMVPIWRLKDKIIESSTRD